MLLACILGLAGNDVSRDLQLPAQGSASQQVIELWNQTRPILLADAGEPLSDSQAMARGAPLVESWTKLETSLAGEASGETGAVLKLLHDFYGRPDSTVSRRTAVRNQLRSDFAQRLSTVENRLMR